ncbi:hypothetical protein [Solirubrum puertoriconensis]|uniref:STAS/SEC14 domain-containing protein n=1 Tax=Solirubrum puertoriconensis TaxID=1751427 RepID=A0A9X0L4D4_SOLP1|nr:hypothetical protein [Solirubrum puertoriconensis]KUG07494.1 hypothetical protein ASU33_14205 [Solirubrum puertoriconensis]
MEALAVADTIFANSVAELSAAPNEYLRLTWRSGPRYLDDFQAVMNLLLQVCRRQGTGKVLVDQRDMAALTPAEGAWIVEDWLPRSVVQGNYRYAAVLPPTDPEALDAIRALKWPPVPEAPYIASFTDESAALTWLRRQVPVASML